MKKNISSIASQRLDKFEKEKEKDPFEHLIDPTKKYGREKTIYEKDTIETNRYGINRYLIDVSTTINESNYKFLKIWKLYQPTTPSQYQWEHTKQGITIPIKDAKKMIKDLYHIFYPSKK